MTRASMLTASRRAAQAQGLRRPLRGQGDPASELPDPAVLLSALGVSLVVTRGRRLVWANAAAARLLGYTIADLLEVAPEALFATPRSFRRQALAARSALRADGTHTFEQPLRTRDGSLRWMRITGRRLDPAEEAAGTLWSIEDTHEAQAMADARRERRYREMVTALPDLFYAVTPDGSWGEYSPQVEAIFGVPAEVLAARPALWGEAIHEEDRTRREAALSAAAGGRHFDLTYRLRDAHGRWHWLQDRSFGTEQIGERTVVRGVATDVTRRREAEAKASLYEHLIEYSADPLYVIDPDADYRFVYVNDAAIRHFGRPRAELLTLCPAVIDPGFHMRNHASLVERVRSQGAQLITTVHRRADGHELPVELSINLVRFEGRELLAGYIRDISARHDAERTLRERDERARKLASEVPGLIYQFRVDANGWMSLPFASEGIRHIFGVSPDDVRSDARPAFLRMHPDDLPGVIAAVQASARDLAPLLYEARVTLPDGTVRWRRAEGTPERTPEGGTVWHGYISDVHALKEAEAALRDSEDRFRSVFEQTGIGIGILDHAGRIVDGNAALRRMVDYSFDELRGKRAIDLAHPDDRPAIEEAQRSFASGTSSVHSRELRFLRKDGSSVWFYATLSMIPRRNAAPVVTVVLEDISERIAALRALRASEALYGSLVDAIPLCIYRIDLEGRIVFVNRALQERFGQPLSEIVGRNGYEFFGRERAARYREVDRRIIETGGDFHEIEEHVSRRTGMRFFTEITKVPVRDTDGSIVGIQGLFSDVTQRIEAEREIRLLANVFESSHQAIMITDATPRIVRVNAAFEHMTGYAEVEVRGRNPSVLRAEIRPRGFYEDMWRRLESSGRWDGELWNRRKDGSPYPELLSIGVVRDQDGKITHYVGQFADITERKATEARIEYLAHHDVVTELPNRTLLADRAQMLFAQAARRGIKAGVLFLDLDRFKNVNDALGHDLGDELLREAGRRLSAAVRGADTVSRTGGDEFVILLSELQLPEDAGRIARNLQGRLAEPFHLEGRETSVTCSIGIAIYPDNGRDLGELQRNADAAMYSAKARGRDRFCFYAPEMNERASERLAVENDLRRALRGDEFYADYQPQVCLATGEMVGVEALARWRHPDRGIVSPAAFIPIAEETGLIVPLGERILEIACRQRRECYDHGHLAGVVAVNVSALQFREARFVDTVKRVLNETRLAPSLLELEVTESVLMHGADTVAGTLNELAALGVGLAIDDFGTGYSSLSYLKHFPVRRLKIDQSFVREMTRDANSGAIVEAIIALGRVLKMSVVAEGVETAQQLEVLRGYGCDDVQGYFVRRPGGAAEIASLCAPGAFAHLRSPTV